MPGHSFLQFRLGSVMLIDEQHAAGTRLFDEIQARFPEARLIGVGPGPSDPSLTVVEVATLADDERDEELRTFAAERATDMLLENHEFVVVVPGYFEIFVKLDVHWGRDAARRAHYRRVRDRIAELVESAGAGEEVSSGEGLEGGLYLVLHLRDAEFVQERLIRELELLEVANDAAVYWRHPYPSPLTGRQTQLYPREGSP
jgi:hypothetical protein